MIAGSLGKSFHLTFLGFCFYKCEGGDEWPWFLHLGDAERDMRDKVHGWLGCQWNGSAFVFVTCRQGTMIRKQTLVMRTAAASNLHGLHAEAWERLVKEQRAGGTRQGRSPKASPPCRVTPGPPAMALLSIWLLRAGSHLTKPTHTFLFAQTICPLGREELFHATSAHTGWRLRSPVAFQGTLGPHPHTGRGIGSWRGMDIAEMTRGSRGSPGPGGWITGFWPQLCHQSAP